MPDGTQGAIDVTFKYRTRAEYAEFIAQSTAMPAPVQTPAPPPDVVVDVDAPAAAAAPPAPEPLPFIVQHAADLVRLNSAVMVGAIEKWNLDEPVDADSLHALADQLPAAAIALIDAYAGACLNGRLGN
jgi:hypothetical protein